MKWTARFGTYVPAHYALRSAIADLLFCNSTFIKSFDT